MSEDLDVVEFGPAPAAERPRPAWREFAADVRLTIALAVLGGAAAVASLLGEWQVISVAPDAGESPAARTERLVNWVWSAPVGTPYLVGLILLGMLTALALSGPAAARPIARVAGAGAAVTLFAVLAAATGAMSSMQHVPQFFGMDAESMERFSISLGRGLYAALAAPALLGLAMLVAHRQTATRERLAAAETAEPDDYEPGDIELTVTTAAPFVRQY